MPVTGYFAAVKFTDKIIAYDHWVAFILLGFIGGKMLISSFKKDSKEPQAVSLKPARMLVLSIATSIDALAVGISFAFLQVDIISAALIIGGLRLYFVRRG